MTSDRPESAAAEETLTPAPEGSTWGRKVATIYLVVVALALVLVLVELPSGKRGLGGIAVSILTAPWSGLLAPLAQMLAGRLPLVGLRIMGLVLAALSALLNARVFYGIAARAQRDAASRAREAR